MTFKRFLLQSMDRALGRPLLASLTTRRARRILAREDVAVAYEDGLWVHRVGAHALPDGPRFAYHESDIEGWGATVEGWRRNADERWFTSYTPSPGDVIVDIGAGRGEDVLAFSERVGPEGRVIAVEAHPGSFRLLDAFCRLNGLRNVTRLNCAVMDATGSVVIEDTDDWKENTVSSAAAGSGSTVPARTLDDICREQHIAQVAFVKMNIEGAERQALPGMRGTLARLRHICVCCHDFRADKGDGEQYRTRTFVQEFLEAHGFDVTSDAAAPRAYLRDHLHGTRRTSGDGHEDSSPSPYRRVSPGRTPKSSKSGRL